MTFPPLVSPIAIFIWALNIIVICILVDVVLSWISAAGGRIPWYNPVIQAIHKIADGVLSPIRSVLFHGRGISVGGMGIDLSPLIALILLQLVQRMLWGLL